MKIFLKLVPLLFFSSTAFGEFFYDTTTGNCINEDGIRGFNSVDSIRFTNPKVVAPNVTESETGSVIDTVIERADAECIDFSKHSELSSFLPDGALPFPTTLVKRINLKGSKWRDLRITNLTIDSADFSGGSFESIDCVYSSVGMVIDSYSNTGLAPNLFEKNSIETMRGKWRDQYIDSLDLFCTTNSFFN